MMKTMKPFPLPLRVAVGLVATACDQARDLPRLLVEFPVTAVSQTLQASMRVQQKVTELAIRGDRALGALRPVEDKPSWATFDDEEPPRRNGSAAVTELRPARLPVPRTEPESSPPGGSVKETDITKTPESIDTTASSTAPDNTAGGPNVLPGYRELTIPQLRGRLRHMSVEDLQALLDWETAHDDRPAFVTMLSNRITTVSDA
jgi:hypothetical protein